MRYPLDSFTVSQGYHQLHQAIDLAQGYGVPVKSPVSGTVISVGFDRYQDGRARGGNYVIVRQSAAPHYEFYMGHNSVNRVPVGQVVSEGQHIADVGATGEATGSHVHFQIRQYNYGALVNPATVYGGVSAPSGAGGSDVITQGDVGGVRIINSEVEGYPFHETHAGQFDAVEMKAWVGNTYSNLIQQKWRQGQAFRDARLAKDAFYNTWANKVGELSTRPTKAELEALNLQLKSAHQAVIDSEAKLAEQLAKPPEVIKEEVVKPFTDQDGMNWLRRKWQDFISRFKK